MSNSSLIFLLFLITFPARARTKENTRMAYGVLPPRARGVMYSIVYVYVYCMYSASLRNLHVGTPHSASASACSRIKGKQSGQTANNQIALRIQKHTKNKRVRAPTYWNGYKIVSAPHLYLLRPHTGCICSAHSWQLAIHRPGRGGLLEGGI